MAILSDGPDMTKIGVVIIATRKYFDFVEPLLESIRRFFLVLPGYEVVPFVFTDRPKVSHGAVRFKVKHRPWPMMTLLRFHMFLEQRKLLEEMDYLFYCDADMRVVDFVGEEILGTTVATIHPLAYDKKRAELVGYENRMESKAYIPPDKGQRYYQACFFGGRTKEFFDIATELAQCIDEDLNRGIIAKWHDESHLNRFFADHPPDVELSPAYCYPEKMSLPFKPKIIGVEKNNKSIRTEETILSRLCSLLKWCKFSYPRK